MRILHIVTLVTPDGAYGGPVRVALNQTSTLQERGHGTLIAAGSAHYKHYPAQLGGVPVKLFRSVTILPITTHFSATLTPNFRSWIKANASQFDMAHIHLARDMTTVPAALQLRRMRFPYVCQTHGMIRIGGRSVTSLVDKLWINDLLRDAGAVLCLNEAECQDVQEVAGPDCNFRILPNGIPLPTPPGIEQTRAADEIPEVLFLSRLHRRKQPELFARAALHMLRSGMRAKFSIVGPNDGDVRAVDRVISAARREGYGPHQFAREPGLPPDQVSRRLRQATVYVLPSVREPFGITVAEALAVGVPVVIRDDGGLAEFVRRYDCGICVTGSVDSVVDAVTCLLANPALAEQMGRRGAAAVSAELNSDLVADRLEKIYREISPQ